MGCQRHHNVVENPSYNLQYVRSIIYDRTIHNNRPDVIIFDKTIKETYLIDATVLNSHNLHSTITEKLQKCTEVKQERT
jgi:hypothetical protein